MPAPMTRNRESVLLTQALNVASEIGTALAVLPEDQHPQVHDCLNRALHCALIAAEEVRQQWDRRREQ